jgi:hypothetical protein
LAIRSLTAGRRRGSSVDRVRAPDRAAGRSSRGSAHEPANCAPERISRRVSICRQRAGWRQKRCQSQRPADFQPVSLRDRSARSLAGTRPPRARSGRSRADLPQMSCTSSWTPFCRRGRPVATSHGATLIGGVTARIGRMEPLRATNALHGSRQPSAAARRDIPTDYRGLTPMSLRPLACCWVSPGSDGAGPSHRCRASSNGALRAGQIKAILRRWRTAHTFPASVAGQSLTARPGQLAPHDSRSASTPAPNGRPPALSLLPRRGSDRIVHIELGDSPTQACGNGSRRFAGLAPDCRQAEVVERWCETDRRGDSIRLPRWRAWCRRLNPAAPRRPPRSRRRAFCRRWQTSTGEARRTSHR